MARLEDIYNTAVIIEVRKFICVLVGPYANILQKKINKSMAPEPLNYSLSLKPKMKLPSQLSATFVILPRPDSVDEEEFSHEDVVKEVDEVILEVEEANSNELVVDAVTNKEATADTMLEADVVVLGVDVGSDGKTTINHSEIGMLQSISRLIGKCLKKSTLFAWPS